MADTIETATGYLPPVILATHRLPGLVLVEHELEVPLDHDRPDGERITIFAREVAPAARARERLPYLVFLQGGPGSRAPRPESAQAPTWLERALEEYRVVMLDQRGTGRSTPVDQRTLARCGDAAAQAAYLRHFRADAIVQDAEWVRRELVGSAPWTVLGQSYGGFCAVTYLSFAPEGLEQVLITGGLPSLDRPAEDVYRAAFPRVRGRNRRFVERYPGDEARLAAIADRLEGSDVRFVSGDRLTVRRLQAVGITLGMSYGAARLHYLLEQAFVTGPDGPEISQAFLRELDAAVEYEAHPIFSILHESIYGQGAATRWAAERVRAEHPDFEPAARPLLLTGEMIFPWMLEDYGLLRPLRETAEILAAVDDWPPLYDPAALARNEVPVAAVVYANDMYVDREQSLETADRIRGLQAWVTNEYEHDGLRTHGVRVLGQLLAMAADAR
jgi:pimeloyl-ACP methyl ester carboxylesterase